MAGQIKTSSSEAPFDYELYDGDPDQLKTVDATPALPNWYIDPTSLKLKYRIGHGCFGDVWMATHHRSASDFDEYHEVVVKMLHQLQEDHINEFLCKFEELWIKSKSQQLQHVCWLHGISVISGQVAIALKSYEGSIGDRMALQKGGKLPLVDVLRYGIELAQGIQRLHQIGILVLNVKPTNFLLDENDSVILGDFGIPYLLLGIPWHDPHLAVRLGTPNYMASEQWQPGVRGPISYETDSWGFACSIIEMLTGTPPWFGRSVEEIQDAVVTRKENPQVPSGLPPAVEDVLNGCFENDFRNRPLMSDILHAFQSSLNALHSDGTWSGQGNILYADKSHYGGYTKWFLSKEHLQLGDTVRPRKSVNLSKPQSLAETGVVVGLEKDGNWDGFALVQIPSMHNQLRVNVSAIQRITSSFVSGDWVYLIEGKRKHSSLGVLHSIQRDGSVAVGFLGLETLWKGHCSDLKNVPEPFFVGQFVRLNASITTPQFEWPHKRGGAWASGKISQILPNGCLEVTFPGRLVLGDEPTSFLAKPEEVEHVSFDKCPGLVEKYQHVEDFHWAVRPVAIALCVLTATKLCIFVGQNIRVRRKKCKGMQKQNDACNQEGQSGGNSAWLPPSVANILFKEDPPISSSQ